MEPGLEEITAGGTTWRFERSFLTSNWTCIWGRGCLGILAEPAEELGQGCCSIGAHIDGEHEAQNTATLAGLIHPELFEHHREAAELGVFSDETRSNTRVVDGACIFLNRPDFPGGAGCALHLAALADDEPPMDWKPSVCWQLPIHVDWDELDPEHERATVRAWTRADWGDDGEPMHWCCTEGERAYVGDRPVIDSLADELVGIAGREVYVELRRRLDVDGDR